MKSTKHQYSLPYALEEIQTQQALCQFVSFCYFCVLLR